jgi:hypothetical protein
MLVIAALCGEGSKSWFLKVFQYAWSAVGGAGPGAARMRGTGWTAAAMVAENNPEVLSPAKYYCDHRIGVEA